ncbi:tRNA (adenosine(37)-N6)-threonylcarbamoyltransferase complex dimerization subunit type 1 TsaB [Deinococcus malanensis]|uniref:tRNA (Adenosine(37)-N6)-threonylcarbamoyltransferase complex dimerization subunit type 1 TsaB n=1 Tax=Deinococcus malanensis TaxID=1706855 RepID=A0ABQ2EG19_9DEIO|nr:tRNA (adenosine(37)-N6)-threonylcarbamoyltransferase complex dimerization subunit type 1 TsaB [Deinococcus malanensis]GGK10834.1 tRNA (adenosine(37)-N6)-threonylcarbamoyltransferase complex dimerization subunit type 1 TsaB [Deinococcus malanensis]
MNTASPAPQSILALDTATPFLTLALVWPGGQRQLSREVGRAHAEQLASLAHSLFEEAGLPFRARKLVIGTGPGSYTGVRVGASYALGLARVWGASVQGVPTLEGLVRGEGRQAVSLDARKGHVYGAVYDVHDGVVTSVVHPPQKLTLEVFEALAGPAPHHRHGAPDGLALLHAGLAHGQADWSLAYL